MRSIVARCLAALLALSLAVPELLEARVEPTHGFDMFSTQEEIQAGQQAAAEIPRQLPLLPDSDPVARYVQRLGMELASHAPGEKWPYSFHVVNQKEINAFALPGGPVFVNLGTIQATDHEAELAGVIAHEISHVVQRHGTRAASKQMIAQVPLAILGGAVGGSALRQLGAMGLSFGLGSYLLKNSRKAETEADLLGTDIMYDSGFDPHALAVFFAKIEEQGGSRSPQFLSDHPDPGNRAQIVSKEVSTLARRTSYRVDSPEYLEVKRLVSGMQPLSSQQIHSRANEENHDLPPAEISAPSSNMSTFRHRDYTVSYPENWRTMGDQNSAVTIAPPEGLTQNAVAYGVMISTYEPENSNSSLDQDTHDLLASLRQSNPDLREIGNDEDIRVNGVAGKSIDLVGTSPVQENGRPARERDWLVTVNRRDGSLLYLIFIAPDNQFNSLRPTFEQVLKSLRLQ
jgi:Zn-dependent protease with chaperone function